MGQQMEIEISRITENDVALRGVDIDKQEFKDLVASIRSRGVLNPISVRPSGDGNTYIVVDGLQRFTASGIAGLEKIPCQVLDIDEDDVLETQIEANLHRIEMKPIQYTKALQRIMLAHPERTIEEQAKRLNRGPGWLRDRLSLDVFEGAAAEVVDKGDVPLSNAYALAKIAKLAPGEVEDWLERAQTQAPEDFIPEALKRVEVLKAAQKRGEKAEAPTGPAAKLRKLGDIKAEYQRIQGVIATKPTEFNNGYLAAFQYVLSQDPTTVEAWKKAEAERQAEKAERAKEREAEKARKAAAENKLSIADLVAQPKKKVEE